MPEGGTAQLRIYCICGQKMKFSSDLFGKPGKCVACRQKIRVPKAEDLPEGTSEIYLKDHPELIRRAPKPRLAARPKRVEPEPAEGIEVIEDEGGLAIAAPEKRASNALPGEDERISTVPLDTLEPLRNLLSVQYKLSRQLKSLSKASDADRLARDEIKRHLERLKRLRVDLDDQLRQVLMEVAIELTSTQEKIVQTGLTSRVGEMPYDEFHETIDRLRRRRDRLERRQHNLRGWLATADPHFAGGFIDLPLESIPKDNFTISMPVESDDAEALLTIHTAALRDALHRRSHADRKLREMDRMQGAGQDTARGFREARSDVRAERKVAGSRVSFQRKRLEQMKIDYDSDAEVIDAQLDLARGRLQVGELDRAGYDDYEDALRKSKTDLAKAKLVIDGALNAQHVDEVPNPRGTFLRRLALRKANAPVALDAIVAWGAALVMGLSIFLPAVDDLPLARAYIAYGSFDAPLKWSFLGPIVFGLVVAGAGALNNASLRSRALCIAWIVATLVGAVLIHEVYFGVDPLSTRFRAGAHWMLRPGMMLLVLSHMAVLGAAAIAAWPDPQGRIWVLSAGLAGVACAGLIYTDGFGLVRPKPRLSVILADSPDLDRGIQRRLLRVSNGGSRAFSTTAARTTARGAYMMVVERKSGANSFEPVFMDLAPDANGVVETIRPKALHDFEISLTPGIYRAALRSDGGKDQGVSLPFDVVAVPETTAPSAPSEGPRSVDTQAAPENPEVPTVPPAEQRSVDVSLDGIMGSTPDDLRFRFLLTYPNGTNESIQLGLGDTLLAPWTISEFNPDLHAVTLSDVAGGVLTIDTKQTMRLIGD